MNENEAILTAAFGEDWEMYLISEGVAGGTNDDEVDADRTRVYELARNVEAKLLTSTSSRSGSVIHGSSSGA